jgi:hypothetical protein
MLQSKEMFQAVVEVLDGNATTYQIENYFTR